MIFTTKVIKKTAKVFAGRNNFVTLQPNFGKSDAFDDVSDSD